jgi:hypothetical protein
VRVFKDEERIGQGKRKQGKKGQMGYNRNVLSPRSGGTGLGA